MTEALYREFVLTGPGPAREMMALLRTQAGPSAGAGRPLRVIVTEEEADRLEEQIRFYFGVVLRAVSEQAWVAGRRWPKEVWHEEFARRFLPGKEVVLPSGEVVIKRASIARGHIGVRAMAKFTQEVMAHAAAELGVEIPA